MSGLYTYSAIFEIPNSVVMDDTGVSKTVLLALIGATGFAITPDSGNPLPNPTPTASPANFMGAVGRTILAVSDITSVDMAEINTATYLGGAPLFEINGGDLAVTYDNYTNSAPASSGFYTTLGGTVRITMTTTSVLPSSAPPAPAAGTSTAKSTTIRYRKVVCWGLSPSAVNFAQAGSMGHRVSIVMPVDLMNKFFTWTRASGEVAPTGRFTNKPNATDDFTAQLTAAFNNSYTDLDGVANGLNFSSSALDIAGDIKRDASLGVAGSRYSANDLVMAYLMYKCFGSSSYDPTDVIYNVDDAFNMLSSAQLAELITASLQDEDALANAAVLPNGKNVNQQLPGDNKGQVDAMFRGFLAADPMRYFLDGKQIPGLFETNFSGGPSDPSVNGNWCLTVGDKIEVPLKLVFRAPVSVLSVQDNVQNPSSATPDSVQTKVIAGEAATFDCTSQKASPANEIPIRLQITCGSPAGTGTGSTSATGTDVPLSIAASSSVIFYTPKNYGAQSAIPVVAAGGSGTLTYTMVAPIGLSADVSLSTAGVLSFNAATATTVAQWGKWMVPITVTDSASTPNTKTQYVNISLDDGNGASNNSIWINAESANIAASAPLAPYNGKNVVQPRQALQYANAPYGKDGTAGATGTPLEKDQLLANDTILFTYTPPPVGSLGDNIPSALANEVVEWKMTSQSGKGDSSTFPTGVSFAPTAPNALTANLVLDFVTAPAPTGLYSFLVTAKDNNGYVQTFPVTINIVDPPASTAAAPLGASTTGALTDPEVVNGSILRIAAGASETITLGATGATGDCKWSLSKVFGDALGITVDNAVVASTNDLVIDRAANPAATSCILVTCKDAQNVSYTIFYTVVYV